jgi:hypothetical protein
MKHDGGGVVSVCPQKLWFVLNVSGTVRVS